MFCFSCFLHKVKGRLFSSVVAIGNPRHLGFPPYYFLALDAGGIES